MMVIKITEEKKAYFISTQEYKFDFQNSWTGAPHASWNCAQDNREDPQ